MSPLLQALVRLLAPAALIAPLSAQIPAANQSSVRFHGSGAGRDRARIPVDDDLPGADASSPCDVGASSFTLEPWIRGTRAVNPTGAIPPGSYADARWTQGDALLDRSISNADGRAFGGSICGGRVAFFTGGGAGGSGEAPRLRVVWRPDPGLGALPPNRR